MTISELQLSGSTDGRNIKVVAIATAGTLVHTAHATSLDKLWLYAVNTDTTDRKLTIEAGGVSDPDDLIEAIIPAEDGPYLIVPGIPYSGSVVIRAFAAAASVINVFGHVTRIS